jgi:biotin carboxylase
MFGEMVEEKRALRRPLVAVGYGPRCVPVMQIAEAAADLCELLWLIDGSLPEMGEMTELLNYFGPVVDVSQLSVDEIVSELTAPYRPDGIVTYLDARMAEYSQVAESLGLPFHSYATSKALTDKAEQRRVLREAGLDGPACVGLPAPISQNDLLAAEGEVGWPAVLKPRSAQGSRYTFYVESHSQLSQYLDELGDRRPDMVLESYLSDDLSRTGHSFADYVSVESVVAHGVASHLALTGRFAPAENFRETGFFIPADVTAADQAAVLDLTTRAIEALGVSTGCLHTEVKFTQNGPRIIEVNGRVGGGVPEMLERAAGVKLVELTLRLALGESVRVEGPVVTERVGYRFFLQPPPVSATVVSITGIDTFSEHPSVESITVHQGPGAVLDWKDGSRNRIVSVVGTVSNYDELEEIYAQLQREIVVTFANVSHVA